MRLDRRLVFWALGLGGAAMLAAAAFVVLAPGRAPHPPQGAGAPPPFKGEMGDFSYFTPPRPVPPIRFEDGAGKPLGLDAFKGKVVLVNFWATWCAPCKREMPSLDRLQAALGGKDFAVVDIALDREGKAAVAPYFATNALTHLGIYLDPSGEAFRSWKGEGVPTSFLLDREGRARGVMLGPAAWDSEAAQRLIRHAIGDGRPAAASEGAAPRGAASGSAG